MDVRYFKKGVGEYKVSGAIKYKVSQGWEGHFGNVMGYRLLVTLFKM